MKANVKYFGIIAEKINCKTENIEIMQEGQNVKVFFEQKYPILKGLDYKIAINQEFSDVIKKTNESIEITLLPPFAGG